MTGQLLLLLMTATRLPFGWSAIDPMCPQGTYIDPGGRCSWCREGTYQDETGQRSCKQCRRGMISMEIAATSPTVCRNCPNNAYASSASTCSPCPPHTISPAGAVNRLECTARAGYFGLAGDIGEPCPANFYCVQGTSVATPCAEGTISEAGSHVCTPGIQSVVLYDWVFSLAWLALFFSGAVWLGAYKTLKDCTRHIPLPPSRTIQIRIIRGDEPQTLYKK